MFRKFAVEKSETAFHFFDETLPFTLPWSHYLLLMRIKDENERKFYEIEATQSGWSIRTLQRQYNSSLYERLALSREKGEVLRLASEGNIVTRPRDIVKQPTVDVFAGQPYLTPTYMMDCGSGNYQIVPPGCYGGIQPAAGQEDCGERHH